jgi:hypothetical protein
MTMNKPPVPLAGGVNLIFNEVFTSLSAQSIFLKICFTSSDFWAFSALSRLIKST